MAQQTRKTRRKPTKAEIIESLKASVQTNLREEYSKGLITGNKYMAQVVLHYINSGKSLDEVKHFCEITLKNEATKTMNNIINNK